MSTDGGHIGCTLGSSNIILKGGHLRTIQPNSGHNWPRNFSGEEL